MDRPTLSLVYLIDLDLLWQLIAQNVETFSLKLPRMNLAPERGSHRSLVKRLIEVVVRVIGVLREDT